VKLRKVIFKFDDLMGRTREVRRVERLVRFFDLKVTWGLIGSWVEKWDESEVNWFRQLHESGRYYFWNHGDTHAEREFESLSVEESVRHICRTQTLVREKLGIALTCFGAPCNAITDNTMKALEAVPEIRTWLFGLEDYKGINYRFRVALERPFPRPNFIRFLSAYGRLSSDEEVVVLQGHPNFWGFWDLFNFTLVVIYLKCRHCVFVFP